MYGTPEGIFSFLYLSENKLKQENQKINYNIISRINDLLCRLFNLLISFEQHNISVKRLIMPFLQDNRKEIKTRTPERKLKQENQKGN